MSVNSKVETVGRRKNLPPQVPDACIAFQLTLRSPAHFMRAAAFRARTRGRGAATPLHYRSAFLAADVGLLTTITM